MNLYIKAIGFEQVDSDFEEQMIHAGILDSLEKGLVIKNNELNRGAVIVRISESTGLYIYGRFKDKEFIYEYYFPFVVGKVASDNEMDYLDYICDENGLNQKDYDIDSRSYVYKIPIKNKMVSLTALSLGGIIMLPTRNNKSDSVRMKKEKDDRQRLIQAAKKGDESAIESLTIEDIDTYNELSHRIVKEDVFSIVDSSFMPCGVECDQYQVVGEILELSEEINHYTKEKIYIMVIECNDLNMTVAINQAHLLGEPAVGRRFKGQIWLQGSVKFNN